MSFGRATSQPSRASLVYCLLHMCLSSLHLVCALHHTCLHVPQTCAAPYCHHAQVYRSEQYNEKADVFSFGVMMYEVSHHRTPGGVPRVHPLCPVCLVACRLWIQVE